MYKNVIIPYCVYDPNAAFQCIWCVAWCALAPVQYVEHGRALAWPAVSSAPIRWDTDEHSSLTCDRMLNHHCRRNPELHEELQIQAAVASGDVYTVRRMLEQGYSPKIRDANGWTLLHFSAAKGKERCVRVFLEHGGQRICLFIILLRKLHLVVIQWQVFLPKH